MTHDPHDGARPGLFEATARYYARYRQPYPAALFDLLVDRFRLGASTAVLDLGCGTGQLAIPLAARGVPVHAVDPEVEMLSVGIRSEEQASVSGIAWTRGTDRSLPGLHLPPLRACTMGASFHWTDRDALLLTLDKLIDSSGGVALVMGGSHSVWADADEATPRWSATVRQTVVDFLGPRRRAGGGTYEHPPERHEAVLGRSPFGRIESHRFSTQETMTIDEVIGLQLSTSYASPAQLGPRLDLFRAELAGRLAKLEPSGVFEIVNTTDVIVATR